MSAAALALSAQAAVVGPQLTWEHITLGEPASDLRTTLGDPLRVLSFGAGKGHVARYWIAGSNSTYVIVVEERGYVASYDGFTDTPPNTVMESVPPDPFGVRLGETLPSVRSHHPLLRGDLDEGGNPFLIGQISQTVGVEYSFERGRVRRFQWAVALPADQPALAPLTAPSGDAPSSAILDLQRDERDGVAWEYRYLTFHPCTESAQWQVENQTVFHEGGRSYDRLRVRCPVTKAERDFYFDITNYFGKL